MADGAPPRGANEDAVGSRPARADQPLLPALLMLLAGTAFLIALVQHESGRLFTKTASLDRGLERAENSGFAYKLSLPKKFRDDRRVAALGQVLENGKPLPLRIEKIKHVSELGNGRYRLTERTAYISTADGSDPRDNGRKYELRAPRRLKTAFFWAPLLIFCGAMWWRQRCSNEVCCRPLAVLEKRPWIEPALVLLGSVLAMLWALWRNNHLSDGWLIVDGLPYSDGIGWLELGKSLSEGRGFSGDFEAHRGGYPLLLGGFFSLFGGGSVVMAKLFNVIMLALGATAAWLLARDAFGRGVAFLLLAALLLGARFGAMAPMTMTEPTGFALAAIGLQQLHRALLRPAIGRFLLVGIFLALSNLVRPFTLLALPLFGALILFVAWRERWGPRRFAQVGAAYVGGALIVFAPWVLRQKLDWGVTTLDLNGSVMLYGAAAPAPEGKNRTLAARHYLEGDAAGIPRSDRGARYHYFMDRYKESVGANPGDYFGYVTRSFGEFFATPGFADGAMREGLGAVFFFALAWLAWRRRFPPLVLLAGLWPWLAGLLALAPAWSVVLVCSAIGLTCQQRAGLIGVAVLAIGLCGAGILNALVGNFALNRGAVFIEWIAFLLVATAIAGVARCAAAWLSKADQPPVDDEREKEKPQGQFADRYAIAVLAFFLFGFLLLSGKALTTKFPDPDAWNPSAETAEAARQLTAEKYSGDPDQLVVHRVQLGDYRWFIEAGRDLGHWSRTFEPRMFDRTVAIALSGYNRETNGARSLTLNLPGDQRAAGGKQDFLVVGIENRKPDAKLGDGVLILEVITLIPYDPHNDEIGDATHLRRPPDFFLQK